MSTTTRQTSDIRPSTRLDRVVAVLLAPMVALATWGLITLGLGVDLRLIGAGPLAWPDVLVAALVAGLGGWAALSGLEGAGLPARRWWTVLALVVLALSLPTPIIRAATLTDAAGLVALHLVVGGVLIRMRAGSGRLDARRSSGATRFAGKRTT